ncbi:hypothetical protein TrRE_jg654, partial [Triparma retinervis]
PEMTRTRWKVTWEGFDCYIAEVGEEGGGWIIKLANHEGGCAVEMFAAGCHDSKCAEDFWLGRSRSVEAMRRWFPEHKDVRDWGDEQVVVVFTQNRKQPLILLREVIIVLLGIKPVFDAYRVAQNATKEGKGLDVMGEMVITRSIECIIESIPSSILQTVAFFKSGGKAKSALFTAFEPFPVKEMKAKQDVKGLDKKKISDRLRMAEEEARKLKEINADKLKKGDVTDMDDVEMDTGGRAVKDGLRNLDLDTLAFKDGSRTMTNESCKLPDKSWRVTKPRYEEVHVVPAVRNVPGEGERFVKVTELPKWTHEAFKGMDKLNRLQSKMFEPAFKNSENLLLCAPTGAGKTNVTCLTMLNILSQYR